MVTGADVITFLPHADERGSLIAIENKKDIPFDIRRVYYIYNTSPDAVRGKHAHKNLKQVIICLRGSCDILLDDGKNREIVTLRDPEKGLYIYGLVWREMMHFSEDCILIALVDKHYDPEDYVFEREAVYEHSNGGRWE